jgi:hypothetical protein
MLNVTYALRSAILLAAWQRLLYASIDRSDVSLCGDRLLVDIYWDFLLEVCFTVTINVVLVCAVF